MPSLSDVQISVIIPCYDSLELVCASTPVLENYLAKLSVRYEIIVVDDGSSAEHRLESSALPPSVRLLRSETNRGKGFAVKTGMLAAAGRCRIFTDADLPYELDFIARAWALIESGACHFAAGDRNHPQSAASLRTSPLRRFTRKVLGGILAVIAFGEIGDSQCGFKAFSAELAEALFPLLTIERFGFDLEIYYLLLHNRVSRRSLPVCFCRDGASSVHPFLDGLRTALDMTLIPLKWHTGRYRSAALARLGGAQRK